MTERDWRQENAGSGESLRHLAPRLAAYLPSTLIRKLLDGETLCPGKALRRAAATLFTDLSGFTVMAETLARDGPRGAEELNRALLLTFTTLINAIHAAGGAVSHFHGDAMMVYFPDEDGLAAQRALACARFMQSLMLMSFAQITVRRMDGTRSSFDLTVRIGVGYGRCLELIVGDSRHSLEFVLAGTAVDEAIDAQSRAESGQVVASRAVLSRANLPTPAAFRVVDEVAPVPDARSTIYWDVFDQSTLHHLVEIAPAFMPLAIAARLRASDAHYVAEHRRATSVFVNFEGIDYAAENAGQQLQDYYMWAHGLVERYGGQNGRLNRLLIDDKGSQLHIIFGAPVAPEVPTQAIRLAMALQKEKPAFIRRQQIGLASGQVFAAAVGSHSRHEYTIVGKVVNLSAHMTLFCPDGGVVTDEATYQAVSDVIEFEQMAAVPIKGIRQPVALFLALGERPANTRLHTRYSRWPDRPKGRDKELAVIRQCMERALTAQGSLVLISGPLGGGQANFLATAVRYWLAAGGAGIVGLGQPHLSSIHYGIWQSAWRDFFNLTSTMDVRVQSATVSTRIQALCPDRAEDAYFWLEAMGLPGRPASIGGGLKPKKRATQLASLLACCLGRAGFDQPLLIILEDIHHADQISLELVAELARRLAKVPVLMIVTLRTRSASVGDILTGVPHTLVELSALSPGQVRQVIQQLAGPLPLPPLVERHLGVVDHKGSRRPIHPAFLEESLATMLAEGVLRIEQTAGGKKRWRVDNSRLANMRVPERLQQLLLTRLDQLPALARSLLQTAAVIGHEFEISLLQAVTPGLSEATLRDLLARLESADLIQPLQRDGSRYGMFQPAAHEIVYQSIPFARRQAIHAAIADELCQQGTRVSVALLSDIARHYSHTERHEDALEFAIMAARGQMELPDPGQAAVFFDLARSKLAAMGEAQHWAEMVSVIVEHDHALYRAGRLNESIRSAAEALRLCYAYGDRRHALLIYSLMARTKFALGQFRESRELARNVIQSAARLDVPEALIDALEWAGRSAIAERDYKSAEVWLVEARALCLRLDDPLRLAAIHGATGILRARQQRDGIGEAPASWKRESVPTPSPPVARAQWLQDQAEADELGGRTVEALEKLNQAIDILKQQSPYWLARALLRRAGISRVLGDKASVIADIRQAAALLDASTGSSQLAALLRLETFG